MVGSFHLMASRATKYNVCTYVRVVRATVDSYVVRSVQLRAPSDGTGAAWASAGLTGCGFGTRGAEFWTQEGVHVPPRPHLDSLLSADYWLFSLVFTPHAISLEIQAASQMDGWQPCANSHSQTQR